MKTLRQNLADPACDVQSGKELFQVNRPTRTNNNNALIQLSPLSVCMAFVHTETHHFV